mgnify:CR=1 FL=1
MEDECLKVAGERIGDNQITDAVTQANVTVLGQGPAVSVGQSFYSQSQAQGILFANMVNNQQQLATVGQVSMLESALKIYKIGEE